ncbi:hypothetical protein LINPERHAP2_LOCUS42338, partial [Linum perenne]
YYELLVVDAGELPCQCGVALNKRNRWVTPRLMTWLPLYLQVGEAGELAGYPIDCDVCAVNMTGAWRTRCVVNY